MKILKNIPGNDVTLELSKIKIKNYSDWSPISGAELFQNEYLGKALVDEDVRKTV